MKRWSSYFTRSRHEILADGLAMPTVYFQKWVMGVGEGGKARGKDQEQILS